MKTAVRTHELVKDGIPVSPLRPQVTGCRDCPLPSNHPVHQVPDRSREQEAHRRRIGDR